MWELINEFTKQQNTKSTQKVSCISIHEHEQWISEKEITKTTPFTIASNLKHFGINLTGEVEILVQWKLQDTSERT